MNNKEQKNNIEDTEEIDLLHLLYIGFRYRWLFILLIIIGLAGGYFFSYSNQGKRNARQDIKSHSEYKTEISFICKYALENYNNYSFRVYCADMIDDILINKKFISRIIEENYDEIIKTYNINNENKSTLNAELEQILKNNFKLRPINKNNMSYVISYKSFSTSFNKTVLYSFQKTLNSILTDYIIDDSNIEGNIKQAEEDCREAKEQVDKVVKQIQLLNKQNKEEDFKLSEIKIAKEQSKLKQEIDILKDKILKYYENNKSVLDNYSIEKPYYKYPVIFKFDELKTAYTSLQEQYLNLTPYYQQFFQEDNRKKYYILLEQLYADYDRNKNFLVKTENKLSMFKEQLSDYKNAILVKMFNENTSLINSQTLQINNKICLYVIIGGALGFILACLLVILLEIFSNLRTSQNEDIKNIASLLKGDYNKLRVILHNLFRKKK